MGKIRTYWYICKDCEGPDEPCELEAKASNIVEILPTQCPFNEGECEWKIVLKLIKEVKPNG